MVSKKLFAEGKFFRAGDSALRQSFCKVSTLWDFWAHIYTWKRTISSWSGKFKATKRFLFRSIFPLGPVWNVMCKLWLESGLGLIEWESTKQKLQGIGKMFLKKTEAQNNGALLASLNSNSHLHPRTVLSLAKDTYNFTSRDFYRGEFLSDLSSVSQTAMPGFAFLAAHADSSRSICRRAFCDPLLFVTIFFCLWMQTLSLLQNDSSSLDSESSRFFY